MTRPAVRNFFCNAILQTIFGTCPSLKSRVALAIYRVFFKKGHMTKLRKVEGKNLSRIENELTCPWSWKAVSFCSQPGEREEPGGFRQTEKNKKISTLKKEF